MFANSRRLLTRRRSCWRKYSEQRRTAAPGVRCCQPPAGSSGGIGNHFRSGMTNPASIPAPVPLLPELLERATRGRRGDPTAGSHNENRRGSSPETVLPDHRQRKPVEPDASPSRSASFKRSTGIRGFERTRKILQQGTGEHQRLTGNCTTSEPRYGGWYHRRVRGSGRGGIGFDNRVSVIPFTFLDSSDGCRRAVMQTSAFRPAARALR